MKLRKDKRIGHIAEDAYLIFSSKLFSYDLMGLAFS